MSKAGSAPIEATWIRLWDIASRCARHALLLMIRSDHGAGNGMAWCLDSTVCFIRLSTS